ncbi:hypothetical protein ACFY4C_20850 [Actinomadura viridis]|uniref:hypothetical protein n=1 Tax=Actinomadura viridis TaxID=58110 RepID=UPI0036A19F54
MSDSLESQREALRKTLADAGHDFTDSSEDPADILLDKINAGEVDTVIAWDHQTNAPKTHKIKPR